MKTVAILGLALLVVAAGGLFFASQAGYLSFLGESTESFAVDGYTVEYTANYGSDRSESIKDFCYRSANASAEDGATFDALAEGGICDSGRTTMKMVVSDLDLTQYESVTIRRSWKGQAYGETKHATATSSIMGEPAVEYLDDCRSNSCNAIVWKAFAVGDVFVQRDGDVVVVQAAEGRYLFDADQPLYFSNVVSAGHTFNPSQYEYAYVISGIEVEPLPGVTPPTGAVVDEDEGGSYESPAETGEPGAIVSVVRKPLDWWETFKAWVQGLFS